MSSADVDCCSFSLTNQINSNMHANSMDPDQTAPSLIWAHIVFTTMYSKIQQQTMYYTVYVNVWVKLSTGLLCRP